MNKLTRDEEIFLTRAVAELLKANPGLKVGDSITDEMFKASLSAVLERDQELLIALDRNPKVVEALGVKAYNRCRVAALIEDSARQVSEEERCGAYREARFIHELANS